MKFPDKITPYKESILAKFPVVLKTLQKKKMTPGKLYQEVKSKVGSITEFAEILTSLYALNKIDFIDEEELYYVKDDTM
jgi:hypothetical protein